MYQFMSLILKDKFSDLVKNKNAFDPAMLKAVELTFTIIYFSSSQKL